MLYDIEACSGRTCNPGSTRSTERSSTSSRRESTAPPVTTEASTAGGSAVALLVFIVPLLALGLAGASGLMIWSMSGSSVSRGIPAVVPLPDEEILPVSGFVYDNPRYGHLESYVPHDHRGQESQRAAGSAHRNNRRRIVVETSSESGSYDSSSSDLDRESSIDFVSSQDDQTWDEGYWPPVY